MLVKKVMETNTGSGRRTSGFLRYMRDYGELYLLVIPAVVFTLIFCYWPMYGVQIAFKNYSFAAGMFGSEWVGLKHFERFFSSPSFWNILRNTLGISLYGGVVGVDLGLKLRLFGLVCAFFQLAEQGPVGLGQLVALRLQSLTVSNGLAALGIQSDGLVHQGQLGVLKFLADVLFYQVGIFSHKSNVQHLVFLSVSCEIIYFSFRAFRASSRLFRSSMP